MIAGPSEILVLADGTTPPEWVAMDLFSQAEHDELAQSILLCPDADYIVAVQREIDRLLPTMPRAAIIAKSLFTRMVYDYLSEDDYRHGSLRCVLGTQTLDAGCLSLFRVSPHSGAGAHGTARARGEPSDNLCSQRAEDGSPLVRAQSEVTPPQPPRARRSATWPLPYTQYIARYLHAALCGYPHATQCLERNSQ
jgi:hypothetical protein